MKKTISLMISGLVCTALSFTAVAQEISLPEDMTSEQEKTLYECFSAGSRAAEILIQKYRNPKSVEHMDKVYKHDGLIYSILNEQSMHNDDPATHIVVVEKYVSAKCMMQEFGYAD